MTRFIFSLYPQVIHFVRALGDNPVLVMIIIVVCGSVVYSACSRKLNS